MFFVFCLWISKAAFNERIIFYPIELSWNLCQKLIDPMYVCLFLYSSVFLLTYMSIFFSFIFISWRLFTLQYCSGFCHTLTWISHGFTCVPHPDPCSRLPPYPIPLGLPSAPALSTCLMHPTWAGDLFHPW